MAALQNYRQLSLQHISQLASTLLIRPLPLPNPNKAAKDHKNRLRSAIDSLPSPLRSKIPFLTPFCSSHARLNPLPITGLSQALELSMLSELEEIWLPRFHVPNALTVEQAEVIALLATHPALKTMKSSCDACRLVTMAADVALLIAIGCLAIAQLRPSLWKRSLRILWLEAAICRSLPLDERAEAIGVMWALGSQFRQLRDVQHRPYINRYVALVKKAPVDFQNSDGWAGDAINSSAGAQMNAAVRRKVSSDDDDNVRDVHPFSGVSGASPEDTQSRRLPKPASPVKPSQVEEAAAQDEDDLTLSAFPRDKMPLVTIPRPVQGLSLTRFSHHKLQSVTVPQRIQVQPVRMHSSVDVGTDIWI